MFLDIAFANLLSPPILFFILGSLAGFIKSDLEVPESISRYLSLYLMMSIGFKGGFAVVEHADSGITIYICMALGVLFGFLQPWLGFVLLRKTTNVDIPTAAAVAAHYGSISMVTFVTTTTFLKLENIEYAGYIVAVLALMEAPAIISGLYLAHRYDPSTISVGIEAKPKLAREIFTNGAILLLLGSFAIGRVTGQAGMDMVAPFFISPFQGFLCIYLLDMGLLATKEIHKLGHFNIRFILFAIYMPLIGASIGIATSYIIGLDIGTGMLFTILLASASYIAVPAAMRLALPQAKASIYIPMTLGITFPFNIIIGIPLYYYLIEHLLQK